tara:strand:+ start:2751 stop:3806 length:1056 start_codon:yes stop_codon:yes gene_type:complete
MTSFPVIKNRKIRVAIVGCGRISKNHFASLEKHQDNIQLISICETNRTVLSDHEKKYNIKGYLDLSNMLEKEDLDMAIICTPSGMHAEQTELCAKHGVSVMTEKPMATIWDDGIKMVNACEKAGVRLFVVKQNRKNATLNLLKRAIDEKRFGKIHMVHINVLWNRTQEYYDQASWRGSLKLDGGALMNQASHYVDLLDWLIGPVDKIQAMMSTTRNIEVEDTAVLNITWRDGTLGSMSVTMLTYQKNLEASITIIGEKGTARLGGLAVNEIQHWQFEKSKDYDSEIKDASNKTTSAYGFGHPLYYNNVIEVFRGKAEPDADGREGLKTLEILVAAFISAKDNKTISLPLKN